jgi:heptosyltransferase III
MFLSRRTRNLLLCMKALQVENRQPVDHHPRSLRVQRSLSALLARRGKQRPVDPLHQVIPPLVQPVDRPLDLDNLLRRRLRIARLVLFVPQIEVGAMLVHHHRVKVTRCLGHLRRLMPPPRRLFLQLHDLYRIHHQQLHKHTAAILRNMTDEVRRVLVYRLGSLGDTLVALPALHLIERAFPNAERRLLTNIPIAAKAPPAAAVLENTGLIHGYMRYTAGTRSIRELLRVAFEIRRFRPDVLVYLTGPRGVESARRDAKFFRLAGIRRQVGVPLTPAMQFSYFGNETLPTPDAFLEHEAERLARNIREIGDARVDDPSSWDLRFTPEEHAAAVRAIGPQALRHELVAVSIGTKKQANDWGRDNWRELLTRISSDFPNRALLLLGAPEESDTSEFIAANWQRSGGGPVVNLCGRVSPRESGAVLARARLFLGHDSGPTHLAATVGTPCVAIYSARSLPAQWFPYGRAHHVLYHRVECAGCALDTCIEQKKKCILSITVNEALAAVASQLALHAVRS